MKSLQGKIALGTGASRGAGKGVALGLEEAGARFMSRDEPLWMVRIRSNYLARFMKRRKK